MAGMVKKIMPISRSMSGKEFLDFDTDISIALEYTGSPVNYSSIPRAFPVDVDWIPTANVAGSPVLLSNLALPVVEPIVKSNFRVAQKVRLGSGAGDSENPVTPFELRSSRDGSDHVSVVGSEENGDHLDRFVGKKDDDRIESSSTIGFSDSQDHSHELSGSSDMVETLIDGQELEGFESYMNPANWNSTEPSLTPQGFSAEIFCEDEEASDGEALECRRQKKPVVTFCDSDTIEVVGNEEWVGSNEGVIPEKEVAERPAKRGLCYHCHKGNRFTEKEVCIVCDAKYCRSCIVKAMGSMPEGRKCLSCIGFRVHESKRHMLGKSSRLLKGLFLESEVKQIMESELSCMANQLPSEQIFVNGSPLTMEELMALRSCSNPPRNLKQGNYWYDRVCGFWGKEGQKPCQIITPHLNVGNQKLKRDASNGDTNVLINCREITKSELWMLQSAGVQCAGNPRFWVDADGTILEEGMNLPKGKIWGKKRTKLVCTLLSLPTLESPNPGRQSNHAVDGVLPGYLDQRSFCKALLVGNDQSGTSTVYKQARVLYGNPFSEEERQDIKVMIQSNLYKYLARLLEGREQFEESSLEMRKRQLPDQPGPSASPSEIQDKTDYTIGPRLKNFSDWLINIMVSGNLDIIFPAATREYAAHVEDLWKDAAIQATYGRRDELELPRVASYFLDKAVEIAKVDYEPSDTDILYAEGITSSNGVTSMEFSFPQTVHDGDRDNGEQPNPGTRYQLVRVHTKSLGENCKWLEMFEGVGVVLFCVALTEYDEYQINSNGILTNKMLESKRLFESIVTHPAYKDTNFLLLLNKFDLLEEKIEHVPLTRCEWFQDFNPVFSRSQRSRGNSIAPLSQRAFHYIAVKFKRLFTSLTGRKLYVCPVTALESDTVDSALRYAKEIVKWEDDKSSFSLNESSCESIDVEQSSYSQY